MKAKNTKTNIPEGWKMTTLGEIADFSNGRSSPNRDDFSKFPVYGANGIIGFSEKINASENTIIIGRVGNYCGSLYFSKKACWVTDNAIKANVKENYDPFYFFYLLIAQELNSKAVGSGQPLINQEILNSIDVILPSLPEQRAIGAVLSSFDDKIELLREQNKTLEAIAQALYKRWFVDFEFPAAEPNLLQLPSFQGEVPEGRGGINNSCPKGGVASDRIINNKSALKTFRKQLRNSLTAAEAKLWTHLQNKQLNGRKFRRQFSIDNYILDFYCPSEKLAIELDGEVHNIETQAKYDNERDLFLSYYGIKVLRFENKVVFENIDYLLECIKKEFGRDTTSAATTPPFGHPSLKGGELKGYKSSGGKMINSELGEIPAGWSVEKITELFDFIKGVEPGSINYFKYRISDDYIPFYRVQNISGNNNMPYIFIEKSLSNNKIFEENDILVSLDGTIGKVFIGGSGSYSSGIRKVVTKKIKSVIGQCLIYCFLKSNYFQNNLALFSSGETTIKHAGKSLENLKFVYKPDIFEQFTEITDPIFEKMILNLRQIQTLSSIRDALLPKLISGKIRVSTTPPFGHPSLEEEELEDK